MNFLKKIFAKYNRKRVRGYMRQYRKLHNAQQNRFLIDTIRELTKLDPTQSQYIPARFLSPLAQQHAQLSIKQLLLARLNFVEFNKAVLLAIKETNPVPISMPIPNHWIDHLVGRNIPVRRVASTIKWHVSCFIFLGYGALYALKKFIERTPAKKNSEINKLTSGDFDLIPMVNNLCLPITKNKEAKTIVNWFIEKYATSPGLVVQAPKDFAEEISQHVVVSNKDALLPMTSFGRRAKFLLKSAFVGMIALINLLIGRWAMALMYYELVMSFHLENLPASHRPKNVFCNNSGYYKRPVWTYRIEEDGGHVCCYFYSVNNFQFAEADGTSAISFGWELMNWQHYIVWNELQKNFINKLSATQGTFDVVGEIWFEDSDTVIPSDTFHDVTIFDVSPNRPSLYRALAAPVEFYTPKNMLNMVTDVIDVCASHDIKIAMKPKRDYSAQHSKSYAKLIDDLQKAKLITLVNPQVSAKNLINHSNIIICAPFTSPAIIAKNLGKPIVYYDPNKVIMPTDAAADGIEILQSKAALAEFINTHINNPLFSKGCSK